MTTAVNDFSCFVANVWNKLIYANCCHWKWRTDIEGMQRGTSSVVTSCGFWQTKYFHGVLEPKQTFQCLCPPLVVFFSTFSVIVELISFMFG